MKDELVTPEEFHNWVNVQHYTHCWGGHTEQKYILNATIILSKLNLPWLTEFLKMSRSWTTDMSYLFKGKDNRHSELPGSEFTVGTYFIIPKRLDDLMKERTAIIVTAINGMPAHSSPDYDSLSVGRGMFKGYKLAPGKTRYTLRYTTAEHAGIAQHNEFESNKPTVIGSHLFLLEDMRQRNSLHKISPARTSVLIYNPCI